MEKQLYRLGKKRRKPKDKSDLIYIFLPISACPLPNNYYCTYSPSIFHHQNQHTMKIVELNNDMCHFTIFVMMQYIQLVYLPYPTISHKQKAVAALVKIAGRYFSALLASFCTLFSNFHSPDRSSIHYTRSALICQHWCARTDPILLHKEANQIITLKKRVMRWSSFDKKNCDDDRQFAWRYAHEFGSFNQKLNFFGFFHILKTNSWTFSHHFVGASENRLKTITKEKTRPETMESAHSLMTDDEHFI